MSLKVALSFSDGKTFFVQTLTDELLLDAALRNGIKILLDCREGVCGTCIGQCDAGDYHMEYFDEELLSLQDISDRKILACQTRVRSNASFYFNYDSTLCRSEAPQTRRAIVQSVEQVSDSTAILSLDASAEGERLDYLPGQYARLHVPGTEAVRSYSFANQPAASNQLQFLVRLLPDGAMSNYIRDRCQVGEQIMFEAPFGSFYLRHVERPILMVAGGTGLSALLGMLDQLAGCGAGGQPVHLYYGVRQAADLCQLDRIAAYAEHIAEFRVTPVVSDADPTWNGKKGYVTEHFDIEKLRSSECDMYLCGPPPMVDAVNSWLQRQGITQCRVYVEKFIHSKG